MIAVITLKITRNTLKLESSVIKVLILGARGLLGQALSDAFTSDFEVFAWDRPEINVTNREEVFEKVGSLRPDYIINAAAFNDVDKIETDPEIYKLAKAVNAAAVGYIAECARKVGAVVVHYSTDYVFAGDNRLGYDENAKPNPISKYGETKAEGEQLLQKNTERFYLVRLSRLFGPPSSNSGVSKKSFVDLIAEVAMKGKELRLVDEEVSCPTYSVDLARFTLNLIKQKMPFGIYHGANSGTSTWYSLAQEVFRLKKISAEIAPIKSFEYPRPARRPLFSELLNTKVSKQRPWQEALADYLQIPPPPSSP